MVLQGHLPLTGLPYNSKPERAKFVEPLELRPI